MTAIRGAVAAVLLSATALGLAGCVNAEKPAAPGAGESASYGPPPSSMPPSTTSAASPSSSASQGSPTQTADKHNQADVTFAEQVVLLRQQALTMATVAGASSTNAQVKALSTQIRNDTVPATSTLTTLLSQWGQNVPAADSANLPGVLTDAQMSQLTAAKGTAFDMHWLQYMRANLQAAGNAIAAEQSGGSSAEVKQVAQQWSSTARSELAKVNSIG
jgi:uncharacterized protein (DUF305 family)